MLKNKTAVITGGTRGIGLETVRLFCENNAKVVLFGSKEETVSNALERLKTDGFEVKGYYPNLCDYDEVHKTVEDIYNLYQKIDILINNAGISANKNIENTSSLDFEKIIDVNVISMFNTIKAVVPFIKINNGGVILNTSSMVSILWTAVGRRIPYKQICREWSYKITCQRACAT